MAAGALVQGWADPRTRVLVSAGCRLRGCNGVTDADGRGRWALRLRVVGTPTRLTLPIAALYADATDDTSGARIRVRLRTAPGAPAPAPARRPRARRRPLPAVGVPVASSEATPAASATGGSLVVIGDDLAQGTAPPLSDLLPGWNVRTDARAGRPLAEGMRRLAAAPPGSPVLAFSLFTDDPPADVGALVSAVRTSARRAPCVVWATLARRGASFRAANAALEALAHGELAGRLAVVPWARAVARHPGWLADDGVHATPAGYRARAEMYAQAAQSCAGP